MRYILLILFYAFSVQASGISFGKNEAKEEPIIYTIQLFSAKNMETTKRMLSRIPDSLEKDTHLYKIGNYITGRYSSDSSFDTIKEAVPQFKDAGFIDAYVVKTTLSRMQNEEISKKISEDKTDKSLGKITQTKRAPKISKYSKSDIIQKASQAYKRGNESEAMIYYEMLIASGYKSQKIINNLCYLYGKRGAWFEAKRLIDKESFKGKFLYAYAYGAVLSNQSNYYENLSTYIMLDKSGRLMLLSGYYFEKNRDTERANSFYKMAYEQNPSDVYTLFSYARSEDMQDRKTKAKYLYQQILNKIQKSHPLYTPVSKRVSQI